MSEKPHTSRFDSKKVTATIDLHGYRKSEGIVRLTEFLDKATYGRKGDVWVLIVTGSGAHSSDGPVLRTAVQSLLEKRKMEYFINRGRASFTVKANSGFVLFPPEAPRDTKIIVSEAPERLPSFPRKSVLSSNQGAIRCNHDDDPLPAEVAATDAALEASRKVHQTIFSELKKEENMLRKAVSMSLLEAKRESEEDRNMLKRALSLSMMEMNAEEVELQRALELSQKELCGIKLGREVKGQEQVLESALSLSMVEVNLEEEELQKALELSRNEKQRIEIAVGMEEGEKLMQRALSLSLMESNAEDEQLQIALELSQKEWHMDYDSIERFVCRTP